MHSGLPHCIEPNSLRCTTCYAINNKRAKQPFKQAYYVVGIHSRFISHQKPAGNYLAMIWQCASMFQQQNPGKGLCSNRRELCQSYRLLQVYYLWKYNRPLEGMQFSLGEPSWNLMPWGNQKRATERGAESTGISVLLRTEVPSAIEVKEMPFKSWRMDGEHLLAFLRHFLLPLRKASPPPRRLRVENMRSFRPSELPTLGCLTLLQSNWCWEIDHGNIWRTSRVLKKHLPSFPWVDFPAFSLGQTLPNWHPPHWTRNLGPRIPKQKAPLWENHSKDTRPF